MHKQVAILIGLFVCFTAVITGEKAHAETVNEDQDHCGVIPMYGGGYEVDGIPIVESIGSQEQCCNDSIATWTEDAGGGAATCECPIGYHNFGGVNGMDAECQPDNTVGGTQGPNTSEPPSGGKGVCEDCKAEADERRRALDRVHARCRHNWRQSSYNQCSQMGVGCDGNDYPGIECALHRDYGEMFCNGPVGACMHACMTGMPGQTTTSGQISATMDLFLVDVGITSGTNTESWPHVSGYNQLCQQARAAVDAKINEEKEACLKIWNCPDATPEPRIIGRWGQIPGLLKGWNAWLSRRLPRAVKTRSLRRPFAVKK